MSSLTFEQAFRRFKLTLPDVADFFHERVPISAEGAPVDGEAIEVVSYFQHRLNTHIRTIGGWIFLAENGFLSEHVGRIFLAWRWFEGGMLMQNEPLNVAMKHCFKRFYAECALAECNTIAARALLIEAVVFERGILKELEQRRKDDQELENFAAAFVRCAQFIGFNHEMGHFRV
ncbi:hypothetical protein, partial [Roseateles sp. P5_E11]